MGAAWRRGPLRVTLSGRNIFGEEYYFVANSESADPGPPRQILLRTTSFALGPYSRVAAALFPNRVRQPDGSTRNQVRLVDKTSPHAARKHLTD